MFFPESGVLVSTPLLLQGFPQKRVLIYRDSHILNSRSSVSISRQVNDLQRLMRQQQAQQHQARSSP